MRKPDPSYVPIVPYDTDMGKGRGIRVVGLKVLGELYELLDDELKNPLLNNDG